jgi:hypothetical protein
MKLKPRSSALPCVSGAGRGCLWGQPMDRAAMGAVAGGAVGNIKLSTRQR